MLKINVTFKRLAALLSVAGLTMAVTARSAFAGSGTATATVTQVRVYIDTPSGQGGTGMSL
jgi:hypothetical protein